MAFASASLALAFASASLDLAFASASLGLKYTLLDYPATPIAEVKKKRASIKGQQAGYISIKAGGFRGGFAACFMFWRAQRKSAYQHKKTPNALGT